MHNKFFIIDANHVDASKPVVMTGSTNWTEDQLNTDRNNIIFIQDQSLAKVYTMEFEEMWGSSGLQPDPLNSKFGPDKADNTPHDLMIGGQRVESYFSPSDNVNNQILRTIESADNELYFATMVFTRYDLAYGVEAAVNLNGVYAAGIMNDSSGGSGQSFLIMQGALGSNMIEFDHASQPGILHHKYLIVDQGTAGYDPLVLTGSHNWSSAANQRNDENTVIVHSPAVANQFYQEFHSLFTGSGGFLSIHEHESSMLKLFPNPSPGMVTLTWTSEKKENMEIVINDISGKNIYTRNFNSNAGDNTEALDLSSLAAGSYLVRFTGDKNSAVHKIVIAR
jgi:phosphatidylserine/phosphatidylglycerophosphate/cardiolipin synthase-like enzyme